VISAERIYAEVIGWAPFEDLSKDRVASAKPALEWAGLARRQRVGYVRVLRNRQQRTGRAAQDALAVTAP
jgi:hypothetical protein